MLNMPPQYKSCKEWLLVGPRGPTLSQYLKNLPSLCVDGGSRYITTPDIWIGDGDSGSIPNKNSHNIVFPTQKDHSDLALALELLKQSEAQILHLWGFFGGRIDHFLANIGEINQFLKDTSHKTLYIYDELGKPLIQMFSKGSWEKELHEVYSLFMIEEGSIKMSGECQYPIPNSRKLSPFSSLGLSNSGHGKVQFESETSFMIITGMNK